MTVFVKSKSGLTIPETIRRQAGFKTGALLEVKASAGIVTIVPKLPSADDEYTPEQRRVVDAQLTEGLEDIRKGRTAGPFNTADEMIAHMKAALKKRAAAKRAKRFVR